MYKPHELTPQGARYGQNPNEVQRDIMRACKGTANLHGRQNLDRRHGKSTVKPASYAYTDKAMACRARRGE